MDYTSTTYMQEQGWTMIGYGRRSITPLRVKPLQDAAREYAQGNELALKAIKADRFHNAEVLAAVSEALLRGERAEAIHMLTNVIVDLRWEGR